MVRRAKCRLGDIKTAIANIHILLNDVTFDEMYADLAMKAAFERFLEIASEASRHLPENMKEEHPQVPWRLVADLGNVLRHSYHKTDARILWKVYKKIWTSC